MKLLASRNIPLANVDFDTGNPTVLGEYKLADYNYGVLILKLNDQHFHDITPSLRLNILQFYSQNTSNPHTRKERKKWEKINRAIAELKEFKGNTIVYTSRGKSETD